MFVTNIMSKILDMIEKEELELIEWVSLLNKGYLGKDISDGKTVSIYVSQTLGKRRKEFHTISFNAIDFIKKREKVIIQIPSGQKYFLEYKRFFLLNKEENYDEHIKVTKKEKFS